MKNKLFLIIVGIVFYGLTLRGIYGNPEPGYINENLKDATMPFELSPERGRYALTLAMAEDKTFQLKNEIAKLALPDLGYYKGNFYSLFTPGVSILVLPFYLLGKMFNLSQLMVFSVPAIFAILNSLMLFLILKKFEIRSNYAFVASLIFSFATTSWSYAVTLYQHHITTFLILSGFYYISRFREFKKYYWVWGLLAWLNYAVGIVIDSPNAILLLPIMVYFLISSINIIRNDHIKIHFRLAILYTAGIFIFISAFYGYYNQINFGSWKKLSGTIPRITDIRGGELVEGGALFGKQKTVLGLFKAQNIPNGLYILLISLDRGILVYSPILAFSLLGILNLYKKRKLETYILVALILTNLLFYSAFGDPWGGWAFGPRYLIPSMAILSIFLGVAYQNAKSFWFRLLSVPFILYSTAIALLGALTTNQVPPSVEIIPSNIGHNYFYNFKLLLEGKSHAFAYSQFFHKHISLIEYSLIIFTFIVLIMLYFLFIVPLLKERKKI